jgi:bla regulator protein blaR1
MKMFFMSWLISDKMMQTLCWTLVHSLWQGLLLAIIGAFIIMITRRSSPWLRYNLLTALFILFVATSGITFVRQVLVAKRDLPDKIWMAPSAGLDGNTNIILQDNTPISTGVNPDYVEKMVQYLNEHASLIVAIWFMLFIVKLAGILSNIGYVQRIRCHKTSAPPLYWKQRIMELAQDLGVYRSIQLLESTIVRVPVVIGLLKPVILLPLGLLSNLPPEQVEAVLLHELAHIRRKDYLVNLVQSFAEVIFFFNPAIIWISSLMREERENCCDDVAISRIKNKKQFIHALVAFQEYAIHPSNKHTAIAFAGRKNYLLNRVKRIIYNENKKLNAMEKGFFILSLIAISLVGMVSMKQAPAVKQRSSISAIPVTRALNDTTANQTELTDTVPGTVEFKNFNAVTNKDDNGETRTINATDISGKKYKLVMKNKDPMELYVNDKKIPAGEMDDYKEIIFDMEQAVELRQKKDMEKMKKAHEEQSEKIMKLDTERMLLLQKLKSLDEERAKLNYESAKEFNDHEWENAAKSNLLYDKLLKLRSESLNDQFFNHQPGQDMNVDDFFKNQLLNESFEKFKAEQFLQNENNLELQKQLFNNEALQKQFFNDQSLKKQLLNEKMNLLQDYQWDLQQKQTYQAIEPIIEDMLGDMIITSQQELTFELNADKFVVNGKKQPAEVHNRYKEKYLKKNGDYFKYSRKNGSTSTTIHSD